MRFSLAIVFSMLAVGAATPPLLAVKPELPLLFKDDFEHGLVNWQTTDPKTAEPVWQIVDLGGVHKQALRVTGKSEYVPPFRSPHSIALIKGLTVGDFDLTAKVQNTNKTAGPHRDLCLFWGYQDAAHFYYVHFGAKPDPHACQIFIVNNAERKMITVEQSKGTPWTDDWHKVKVSRRVGDGSIKVYFDDMAKPVMTADDKTFTWGQVGIGTFDDHGNFDDIILRGVRAKREKDKQE